MNETSLGDQAPDEQPIELPDEVIATMLDFDELMSAAKLVERVATINLRGDLEAELDKTLDELAGMIDVSGKVLGAEDALYDSRVVKAQHLQEHADEIRTEMSKFQRQIRFRAMPDDKYRAFVKRTCYDNGKPKNEVAYQDELISECAIEPTLTMQQVHEMRSKLGIQQIVRMARSAAEACETGGLDVPKSQSFSLAQKQ